MSKSYKYKIDLVALHITYFCTHGCPFCYAAQEGEKREHPNLDRLIRVIDELKKAEVKHLSLLGGDPVTYPNVLELAKYAYESGLEVSILSNTLQFKNSSDDIAQYISAFESTIHHSNPEYHDKFCKSKGAYKNVVTQLKKFSMMGKKTGIAVNVIPEIVNKIYELVYNIVEKEQLKLDYIIVQRIVPFGRAASSSEFTLLRKHAEEALEQIRRVDKELGVKITVEDPFPLCILPKELKKYMNPCEWGFTKAAINPNGDLSRCGADPRFLLGNIFETPLLEIWNNSKILNSFRSRAYLPGRCQVCNDVMRCGGGCPLSCEFEKDHGIDYLYKEYEKLNNEIHGRLSFRSAEEFELPSILQIEWANFLSYNHVFNVESLKKCYKHNPNMFFVVRDSKQWVLGYAALIPITKSMFELLISGEYSSVVEFPESEVLRDFNTDFFHIEVIATVPSKTTSRAGSYLIKSVGNFLLQHAKYVTTSPMTKIGIKLCDYFGFVKVAEENYKDTIYPIYYMEVNKTGIRKKISKF